MCGRPMADTLRAIAALMLGKANQTLDDRCPQPRLWDVVDGRSVTPYEPRSTQLGGISVTRRRPDNERRPGELNEEDRARRGHLLSDYLYLDPHPHPLRLGEEQGLHHQLRRRHWRALGRLPRGDRRPRRHRHRRHAVSGGQAAERRHGAWLCRHSHARSRHDLHRCREPPFARDLATGPGRSDRSQCGLADHHRRVARRDLQLGVHARTEPHAGHQRPLAGHRASTPSCWAP